MSAPMPSSFQEIENHSGAPLVGGIIDQLKDMDATRIANSDSVVVRKAVLALLGAAAELEQRLNALESARTVGSSN